MTKVSDFINGNVSCELAKLEAGKKNQYLEWSELKEEYESLADIKLNELLGLLETGTSLLIRVCDGEYNNTLVGENNEESFLKVIEPYMNYKVSKIVPKYDAMLRYIYLEIKL